MDYQIGIIGLGYVGFPLACLFATKYKVIGFDINTERINEIRQGIDSTGEVTKEKLQQALNNGMYCNNNIETLRTCNFYIVAVPTPVDIHHHPILTPLEKASETVGKVIKPGDIVVYESTVYPGVTEDYCIPIIEKVSGLKLNQDFWAGYSPERINPGDKIHTVEKIRKITSGSTPEAADQIDQLYNSVLEQGTYRASSIRVAEAAKIIENSQRDVNIAFINEITKIFIAIGIDTKEVLEAAGTKWNFLPFKPGLVGGHCISVDPYYLIQRAELCGLRPRLIVEARRINDTMGYYFANNIIQQMNLRGICIKRSKILLMGFTFKENCPDIRNTKVQDLYQRLFTFTDNIIIYDPWIETDLVQKEYGISIKTNEEEIKQQKYDVIVHCVNHSCFQSLDYSTMLQPDGFVYYIKEGGKVVDFQS